MTVVEYSSMYISIYLSQFILSSSKWNFNVVSSLFLDLFAVVLSVLRFTDSDYPLGIFKLLIIVLSVLQFTDSDYPLGIFKLLIIVLSVLRLTDSDYPLGIFKLLIIVLSVLRFTDSDYLFGIFKFYFQRVWDIRYSYKR